MNVDEDDDEETQRPRTVADYGIEVDFENLEDDDRDVSNTLVLAHALLSLDIGFFPRSRCKD
jgi:hypothetical protein